LCLLAAANHNVLLIDTEVRGRGPATIVSDQSRAGLIDVASGQKLLSEAVTRDPRTNINVLPLCAGRISSYSRIKDDEIKSAFDQTKRFDLVIVAGTIEDDNPAGRFFADLVDQIVLILKEGTRRRDIDRIIASLGTNSRKVHGTVLTDAKAPIAVPSKS